MDKQRNAILRKFKSNDSTVSSAIAVALSNQVYPIFHVDELQTKHNYNPDEVNYSNGLDKESITKIFGYLKKMQDEENFENVEFNTLYFKTRILAPEMYQARFLEYIIRYFKESKEFDEKLFTAICINAPLERDRIMSEFTPEDVYFE